MSDLEAFVKARLDEDEATAVAAASGYDRLRLGQEGSPDLGSLVALSVYASRHNPGRVLADIKFKRGLLELFAISDQEGFGGSEGWTLMRDAVYQLAALWSDHKDYNPGWRTK